MPGNANSMPLNLDTTGSISSISGSANWVHKASFLPNPAHNSPPLPPMTVGKIPAKATTTAAFGPTAILEPAGGTYHTGAVACSGFFLAAIRPPTPTDNRSLIRGNVQWLAEAPTPFLTHAEATGTTFAQSSLLMRGDFGVATNTSFSIPLSGPDDVTTGGGRSISADDSETLTFQFDGVTLFQESTMTDTTNGGLVTLFPAGAGLEIDANGLQTSSLTWDFSGTGLSGAYFADLSGGVFSASSQWASDWTLVTVGGLVVSARLAPSLVPTFVWDSGPVTGQIFDIDVDGQGQVTVPNTPEPATIVLFGIGAAALAARRSRAVRAAKSLSAA